MPQDADADETLLAYMHSSNIINNLVGLSDIWYILFSAEALGYIYMVAIDPNKKVM